MNIFKRITTYSLLITLMLTTTHTNAYGTSWYQRGTEPLVQRAKKVVLFCKSKFVNLKERNKKKPLTEKQLLFTALGGFLIMCFSPIVILVIDAMAYRECDLWRALDKGAQATINDYLDHHRIAGKQLDHALYRTALNNNVCTTRKLLHMGADPRNLDENGRDIITNIEGAYERAINSYLDNPSSTTDTFDFLHGNLEFFEQHIKPLLTKESGKKTRSELTQAALCARKNNCPKLPPEVWNMVAAWLLNAPSSSTPFFEPTIE